MDLTEIRFYSTSDKFGQFSNFYLRPIKLKGKVWPSVEHYFQAQKFSGTDYENKIRKTLYPHQAASLGRSRHIKLRNDWDRVKDSVMYEAVKAKFFQHNDLKELLLSTGKFVIIEDSHVDDYWGVGSDGKGLNKLGKILMKVREELK